MKYLNVEIVSALVTALVISGVMYYFNKRDEKQLSLKTHAKTFVCNFLVIIGLLYLKKKVLDKKWGTSNPSVGGGEGPVMKDIGDSISVGDPNF
mgnify:CR=1 FL=1